MVEMQDWPALNTEMTPVEQLIPYARNSRTHSEAQVAELAASITEWGFTKPILRDEDGSIIAGHGTLRAAQRLGIKEVPTVIARGWSEAKKRAYVIADNKLAENAGWDEQLLALELSELQEADYDVGLTGFDEEEVLRLCGMLRDEDEPGPDDAMPPDGFPGAGEDIETEYRCPSCGYEWSGKAK